MDEYVLVANVKDDYKLVIPQKSKPKTKSLTINSNGLMATRSVDVNIDALGIISYSLLVSKKTKKVKVKLYKTRRGQFEVPEWCIKQSKLRVRAAIKELGLELPITTRSVKAFGKTIIMEF